MNELGARNAYMISNAMKHVGGDPEEVYFYIEEDLYIDEAEEVKDFLQWLYSTGIGYTEDKAEMLFKLYKRSSCVAGRIYNK